MPLLPYLLLLLHACFADITLSEDQERLAEAVRFWSKHSDMLKSKSTDVHVVLVAGSNGWYNYRHQSHGVKEENIITMMYDDIANNQQNPYPGKLFNNPGAQDVYAGIKIDYKGEDVTPHNFLNILKGNASGIIGGNGRVLESGPDDHVFVYFTDHGAVGLISFPADILTVKDLNDALIESKKLGKFKDLVFYLEACESGSMFEHVLKDSIDVYAVSAANAHESSWGTYCENKLRLPCLGDLFSVSWMEDSDVEDLQKETVGQQFVIVQKETNKSHVMKFGTNELDQDPVGWFQNYASERSSWPAREIEKRYLKKTMLLASNGEEFAKAEQRLNQIKDQDDEARTMMKWVVSNMHDMYPGMSQKRWSKVRESIYTARNAVLHPQCHHDVVHAFDYLCVDINTNPESLQYIYILNNLCVITKGDKESIISAINTACATAGK